jgi:RNase P subunit RPR2
MGYTGKTLAVFSDVLVLETFQDKKKDEKVVFARQESVNRRRLFRALCPNCGAWHPKANALRRGTRKHVFTCTSCGHEHKASEVRRGTEVK